MMFLKKKPVIWRMEPVFSESLAYQNTFRFSGRNSQNSNTVIKQINNLLNEQNQASIGNILGNLALAVQHYDKLTEQLGLQTLPRAADEFSTTFKQTRQVMENTDRILQKLNQRQGLIDNLAQGSQEMTSALASLNDTSQAVTQSTRRLDQLLNLLETHPQSLLFGKPSASPGLVNRDSRHHSQ